jgi:hypothetical protein
MKNYCLLPIFFVLKESSEPLHPYTAVDYRQGTGTIRQAGAKRSSGALSSPPVAKAGDAGRPTVAEFYDNVARRLPDEVKSHGIHLLF